MIHKTLIGAVAFPIVLLLGWVTQLEFQNATGTVVRVPVYGYDPRDLLSGHYLRFTFLSQQSPSNLCDSTELLASEQTCVCLKRDGDSQNNLHQLSEVKSCSDADSTCSLYLQGICDSRAEEGKYYIPESLAPKLSVVPSGATATLSVTRGGRYNILQLYVGDQTIEEYARRQ